MIYRDAMLAKTWQTIKKIYTKGNGIVKFIIRNSFAAILVLGMFAKGKNPIRSIKNYATNSRGMSRYIDVTDWVGGYQFQYASANEVIDFLRVRDFELVKTFLPISKKPIGWRGTGSYQYLFRKI